MLELPCSPAVSRESAWALRPVLTVSCLLREVLLEPASWAVAWDKAGWQEDDVKLGIQTTEFIIHTEFIRRGFIIPWCEVFILLHFKGTFPEQPLSSFFFFPYVKVGGLPPTTLPYMCKLLN